VLALTGVWLGALVDELEDCDAGNSETEPGPHPLRDAAALSRHRIERDNPFICAIVLSSPHLDAGAACVYVAPDVGISP